VVLKETASEIHTNLYNGISGASQILGIGLGGSLTGKHADIVVTDDIVNIKDRVSRAERERTKLMYMELQNIKNRGGRIINTGTPWHKDDAFSLMPNIKKYTCYDTGLMTQDEIKHLRASMSASLFAANYELKHIADENALFTDAQFTSDVDAIYNGICHIDAAYGGEDSTAFTIISEKDRKLIVYGRKYTKHVDACLDDILRLKAKYRAGTTWTERNADKGYLDKTLKARGDISNTYHEKMNKHIKISTYLKENWGRVFFLDDTDPEYIAEILDYTERAAHDDCPDSLASAIRQLGKKPMTLNRSIKQGL
jgi:predicted phage terminase large subunit-like protein